MTVVPLGEDTFTFDEPVPSPLRVECEEAAFAAYGCSESLAWGMDPVSGSVVPTYCSPDGHLDALAAIDAPLDGYGLDGSLWSTIPWGEDDWHWRLGLVDETSISITSSALGPQADDTTFCVEGDHGQLCAAHIAMSTTGGTHKTMLAWWSGSYLFVKQTIAEWNVVGPDARDPRGCTPRAPGPIATRSRTSTSSSTTSRSSISRAAGDDLPVPATAHDPRQRFSNSISATDHGHGHGHGSRPRPRPRITATATATDHGHGHGHGSRPRATAPSSPPFP